MKKIKLIVIALLVSVASLATLAATTQAGDFRSGSNTVIRKGEVIDRTLFIAGDNVEINGEVNGDIFCAGQNITINATVRGDVLCAGVNVRVGGTVEGDVRLAGQVVTLAATVAHSASLAGSTVTTEETSRVGRDLQVGSSMATLNGQVLRDADLAGEAITLGGIIGRDVIAASTDLRLSESAKVTGGIVYYSDNKLQKADAAQIGGEITQKEAMQHKDNRDTSFAAVLSDRAAFFAMLLVLGLAMAALFPHMLEILTNNAITKPGTTALVGLATTIALPLLILASFLTVIGMLLGATLLLFWLIVMLVSGALVSYCTGRWILRSYSQHPLLIMFVGIAALFVLSLIPIINILTMVAIILLGSGMIVRELFQRTPKPQYASVKPDTTKKKAA